MIIQFEYRDVYYHDRMQRYAPLGADDYKKMMKADFAYVIIPDLGEAYILKSKDTSEEGNFFKKTEKPELFL